MRRFFVRRRTNHGLAVTLR